MSPTSPKPAPLHPADDELSVNRMPVEGLCDVVYRLPGEPTQVLHGPISTITARVNVPNWQDKTHNQIMAEAKKMARKQFDAVVKAYTGK